MRRLLLIAAALACLAAGCGSETGEDRPGTDATLLLDFTPNAVHAGIYMAVDRGFDDAEGVSLTVRKPGASTDALKLLGSGRADLQLHALRVVVLACEREVDAGVHAVGREVEQERGLLVRPVGAGPSAAAARERQQHDEHEPSHRRTSWRHRYRRAA